MVFDYYGENILQSEIACVARTSGAPVHGTFPDEMRRAAQFSGASTSMGDELPYNITGYALRQLGYSAFEAQDMNLTVLESLLDRGKPLILSMWYSSSHVDVHYRVAVGYNQTHVFLHDPWNKPLRGGLYGGPVVAFNISQFLDLWSCSDYWALYVSPWNVSFSAPDLITPGTPFQVKSTITYPQPLPKALSTYPASSCNASIILPSGLSLAPGENQTKTIGMGLMQAGDSQSVTWMLIANWPVTGTVDITAEGMISGSVGAHYYYPPYEYSDRIGVTGSFTVPGNWWPMFHHDPAHSGYSTSTAPTTSHILWTYMTGGSVDSSPAVVGGMVYVGSDDGRVYCLNASTGTEVWSRVIDSWVLSSPAVVGGVAFVGSGNGEFYCLNVSTGTTVWSCINVSGVRSSPAVVGGMVYVGSDDGRIRCLNASTGALVWSYTTGGKVCSSPAVVGGMVYVGSDDGRIRCLNASTGALVWSYTTGSYVWSSPAVVGGMVYVGSLDRNVYCLNASTGTLVWSYTTHDFVESSPAVVGGMVYVGSLDRNVYCLNASTGALVWSYTTGGEVWSSPAVVGGMVYVGSDDCNVYCLNASTGALVWSYTTGSCVFSSPAVVDGEVFVGSGDGKVYAFGGVQTCDVAINNLLVSKAVVCQGYSTNVVVTLANEGIFTETFNVTAYANATMIASQNVTLPAGNSTIVTFIWNTTGFAKGNYTISAYAWPVPGETDTADNNMTDGSIAISMLGDVTLDGFSDGRDISKVSRCFGTIPGDPRWNADCDVNNDGSADGRDISIVARHFGEGGP
jgi:outer membrane protein assembly factor BamB